MSYNNAAASFRIAYEINPITLNNGIAAGVPGGALSVLSLLQSLSFNGILSDGDDPGLDGYFATFMPLPSSTLIDNQIGSYPFANMAVAANAIIAQPLVCSMLMRVPVSSASGVGFSAKQAIMTALQSTLSQHNQQEGTYTVSTPTFNYTNLILLHLSDVSSGESHQTQLEYKWDFIKPLLVLQDVAGAQNAMMSALSSGGVTQGNLSGVSTVLGNPSTASSSALSPASQSSPASGVPADYSVVGGF